jgi:hypothetical protein
MVDEHQMIRDAFAKLAQLIVQARARQNAQHAPILPGVRLLVLNLQARVPNSPEARRKRNEHFTLITNDLVEVRASERITRQVHAWSLSQACVWSKVGFAMGHSGPQAGFVVGQVSDLMRSMMVDGNGNPKTPTRLTVYGDMPASKSRRAQRPRSAASGPKPTNRN